MKEDAVQGIFLDIETNGLDCYRHQVLEIAYKVVDLLNGQLLSEYQRIIKPSIENWNESNKASLKFNGFEDHSFFIGAINREKVRQEIVDDFRDLKIHKDQSIFICQNPSFDRSFFSQIVPSLIQERLQWPYHWLDLASMYWASCASLHHGLPDLSALTKDRIAKDLGLPPEGFPHRAMQGVEHLISCYENLIGWSQKLLAQSG